MCGCCMSDNCGDWKSSDQALNGQISCRSGYFQKQADVNNDDRWQGRNARAFSELPYHIVSHWTAALVVLALGQSSLDVLQLNLFWVWGIFGCRHVAVVTKTLRTSYAACSSYTASANSAWQDSCWRTFRLEVVNSEPGFLMSPPEGGFMESGKHTRCCELSANSYCIMWVLTVCPGHCW